MTVVMTSIVYFRAAVECGDGGDARLNGPPGTVTLGRSARRTVSPGGERPFPAARNRPMGEGQFEAT